MDVENIFTLLIIRVFFRQTADKEKPVEKKQYLGIRRPDTRRLG